MIWSIIAALLELAGLWLIGCKKKIGFLLSMAGCGVWIYVALSGKPAIGLILVVVPAIVVNFRNFIKWSKNASDEQQEKVDASAARFPGHYEP